MHIPLTEATFTELKRAFRVSRSIWLLREHRGVRQAGDAPLDSRLHIRWFQIRREVCLILNRTPYPVPSEQSLKRAEIPAPGRLPLATCSPDSKRVIAARQAGSLSVLPRRCSRGRSRCLVRPSLPVAPVFYEPLGLVFQRWISRQFVAQLFRHALRLTPPKRRDECKLRCLLLEHEKSTEVLSSNSLRRIGSEQPRPYDSNDILFCRNIWRERPH